MQSNTLYPVWKNKVSLKREPVYFEKVTFLKLSLHYWHDNNNNNRKFENDSVASCSVFLLFGFISTFSVTTRPDYDIVTLPGYFRIKRPMEHFPP